MLHPVFVIIFVQQLYQLQKGNYWALRSKLEDPQYPEQNLAILISPREQ